jgi:predicted solute-binding protein
MYVNELTCDYGESCQAVRELLTRAEALGTYEHAVRVESSS